MTIAVPYDKSTGTVFGHFGRTGSFMIYKAEDGKIVSKEELSTEGTGGHSALAPLLGDNGIDVLIAGGMGMGARNALSAFGIEIIPGVEGNADAAVEAYLAGNLAYDPDAQCSHHHHKEGGCSHHEGGCGHHHDGEEHHCCH